MIRAMRLMGAGTLPLFLGFLLNRLLLAFPASGMVRVPLSVLLLFAWGYFAFRLSDSLQNAVLQAFLLCAFGLLMLALTLYQELVLGSYWGNVLGYGTQMFFLPWLSLAAFMAAPFTNIIRIWPLYIIIWAGLFLTGCVGSIRKQYR